MSKANSNEKNSGMSTSNSNRESRGASGSRSGSGKWKQSLQLPMIIVVLVIVMAVWKPGMFLTASNINSILLSVCIYGIMMCGTIFPLLNGGIDLSIGSIAALSGCTMVMITMAGNYTVGATLLGILAGLAIGALCGAFNGAVFSFFGIPAFIVTLATKNIMLGIAQHITGQKTITCLNSKLMNWLGTGRILGIQFPIFLFIVLLIFTWWVLRYTSFGHYAYATGGNRKTAKYSGVNTRFMEIMTYTISGLTAGLAGIMLSCFNRQAVYTQGSGYDGDVLVALVVGGVSMAGGEGKISGALFGLIIIGILNNAMILVGIDSIYQDTVKGILVIIAVAVDYYTRTKGNGLKRKTLRSIFAR